MPLHSTYFSKKRDAEIEFFTRLKSDLQQVLTTSDAAEALSYQNGGQTSNLEADNLLQAINYHKWKIEEAERAGFLKHDRIPKLDYKALDDLHGYVGMLVSDLKLRLSFMDTILGEKRSIAPKTLAAMDVAPECYPVDHTTNGEQEAIAMLLSLQNRMQATLTDARSFIIVQNDCKINEMKARLESLDRIPISDAKQCHQAMLNDENYIPDDDQLGRLLAAVDKSKSDIDTLLKSPMNQETAFTLVMDKLRDRRTVENEDIVNKIIAEAKSLKKSNGNDHQQMYEVIRALYSTVQYLDGNIDPKTYANSINKIPHTAATGLKVLAGLMITLCVVIALLATVAALAIAFPLVSPAVTAGVAAVATALHTTATVTAIAAGGVAAGFGVAGATAGFFSAKGCRTDFAESMNTLLMPTKSA